MKSKSWREIAEMFGVAAIVASLIFVGIELRQSHEIALNEMDFVTLAAFFDTRDTENAYSDIWVRGNLGEELDRSEMAIYQNLIRNRHSRSTWSYGFRRRLEVRNAEISVVDLAGFLHRHPNARKVWESLREEDDLYRREIIPRYETSPSVDFDNRVRDVLERLDQMGLEASN